MKLRSSAATVLLVCMSLNGSAVSWQGWGDKVPWLQSTYHKVLTFENHGTLIRLLPGQGRRKPSLDQLLPWDLLCMFSSDALSFPPLWSNHLVFAYFYRWITSMNSSLLQISSKCEKSSSYETLLLHSGGGMSLHHVSSMGLNFSTHFQSAFLLPRHHRSWPSLTLWCKQG